MPPRRTAPAVIDAGADVFHGHSAHVFQGIEIHDGKPILYDTGDLLDDYAVDRRLRNDQQLLFLIEASTEGVRRIELVPLLIADSQVNLARERDFDEIQRRMVRLSGAMGTPVERGGDRLVVPLGPRTRGRIESPSGEGW
jgi:poly-gamma-glutamate synthesis protein (capsule biosynthesis protein)